MTKNAFDRRWLALTGLEIAGKRGLEIGPLNRPMVTRDQGAVYYADHCTTAALREKYAHDPGVDVEAIVEVDFDLSTGRLPELASGIAPFDYVIASHVAEHVPDLVGWLKDVGAVLRPGGVLALVLPDKRFTLDHHRRETPFHELDAAHAEGRTRPDLRIVIDHFANAVDLDVGAAWRDPATAVEAPRTFPPDGIADLARAWRAGSYVDAHCWVFTPWRFLELVGHAVDHHGLDLALRWSRPTAFNSLEFYVQLERPAPGQAPTDWRRAAAWMRARSALLHDHALARSFSRRRRKLLVWANRTIGRARGSGS